MIGDSFERPMMEVRASGAVRFTIGTQTIDGVPKLVTIETIALHASRARGIESDTPRGLTKALVSERSTE